MKESEKTDRSEESTEEVKLLKKLSETYKIRKRRNILAVIFLSSFILCFNISLFIIIDVIALDPIYAIVSSLLGVLFLAIGIYLILDNPPIYVEDDYEYNNLNNNKNQEDNNKNENKEIEDRSEI